MLADSVILAIGQRADLSFLKPDDGVEVTPRGTIKVNPVSLATTAPGIYAGGDIAFGPRNLIEAIANGKQAALSIDDCLATAPITPVPPRSRCPISSWNCPRTTGNSSSTSRRKWDTISGSRFSGATKREQRTEFARQMSVSLRLPGRAREVRHGIHQIDVGEDLLDMAAGE